MRTFVAALAATLLYIPLAVAEPNGLVLRCLILSQEQDPYWDATGECVMSGTRSGEAVIRYYEAMIPLAGCPTFHSTAFGYIAATDFYLEFTWTRSGTTLLVTTNPLGTGIGEIAPYDPTRPCKDILEIQNAVFVLAVPGI